eukprot:gene22523-34570_t
MAILCRLLASSMAAAAAVSAAPPTKIDNGYPNVVPPKKGRNEGGTAAYQLWYGNQATNGTRNRYSLLYANSSDGLVGTL